MIEINSKIVSQSLVEPPAQEPQQEARQDIQIMNETVPRPEVLGGKTYKVKVPTEDHSLYVTINDIVLNKSTIHEEKRPFEIFINSKNNTHRQWVDTLTRVISAVFRKGGDILFLVEELKSITDPQGGGWHKGRYVKSVVSEIGYVLEEHIAQTSIKERNPITNDTFSALNVALSNQEVIPGARFCQKCGDKAVVSKDGCDTCVSCGDSKCG